MSEGADTECSDHQLSATGKMNGSVLNGHSEGSNHSSKSEDLPSVDTAASLKDKLKGNMDGFELVSRSDAGDESCHGNGNLNGNSENGEEQNGVTEQNGANMVNDNQDDSSPPPNESEVSRDSELAQNDEPSLRPEAESEVSRDSELAEKDEPIPTPEAESEVSRDSELPQKDEPIPTPEAESEVSRDSELPQQDLPSLRPEANSEVSRDSEPTQKGEPMEVCDDSNQSKSQGGDSTKSDGMEKESCVEGAEDSKEDVLVLDEATGNISGGKGESRNCQTEDTLTATSEDSCEAGAGPSTSVKKSPDKLADNISKSSDQVVPEKETAKEEATVAATTSDVTIVSPKEKMATDDSDKPPPSPKKKKSKVDRMLENDKKQGSSAPIGSEDLRPFSKLLFELGLDLSRQHVYKDLVKVQKKKRAHKLLNDKEEEQLDKLTEAYEHLVDKNDPYVLDSKKCQYCFFQADTENAMALHREFEHNCMCAICGFVAQNIYAFYFHMEAEHNRQGRVQPVLGVYSCPYCPYEHHSAKKNFLKHVSKCETHFKLDRNLQPVPADCDIPLKFTPAQKQPVKPTAPQPQLKKPDARPIPTTVTRLPTPGTTMQGVPAGSIPPSNVPAAAWLKAQEQQGPQLVQVGNQYFLIVQQNGQTFMTPMVGNTQVSQTPTPVGQPKPAPRPAVPVQGTGTSPQGKFEICEICGGFVKDRESLRIHFFWAHKIEIHPSVMKESPGLHCKSCNQRLWTYQGYKRHVSVSHPNSKEFLQHMTCYVCTSPVTDFITHMTSKHPQVVKHMLSQIRCVVCQDSFPTETALEAHMLVDHKHIVTKYGSLGGSGGTPSSKPAGPKSKAVPTGLYSNSTAAKKCSRCNFQYSSPLAYRAHFVKSHSSQTEQCQICKQNVLVGRPYIEHVTKEHLSDLKVTVARLSPEAISRQTSSRVLSKKRPADEEIIVIDLDKTPKKQRVEQLSEDKDDKEEAAVGITTPEDKPGTNDVEAMKAGDKSKTCSATVIDIDEDAEVDLEKAMETDEESNHSNQVGDDGEKSKSEKMTEEIIEVDGETVVVQKLSD